MKNRSHPLATLLCLTVVPSALAQGRDFDKVEIKAEKVAGSVWMLTGAGGNIGVSVGPDGILIVDDQFAPLADKIQAALKRLGEGKLKFVLNTHWHGDHVGGNERFGKEATIVAHANVRKRMQAGRPGPERAVPPAPPVALPVITFDESMSIHFNGEEIRVLHLPAGHTDGDSVIFFTGSNVVHMGDQLFAGRFPFIDLDSGGDVEGYVKNLGTIMGKLPEGARVIPGHGPLSSPGQLWEAQTMINYSLKVVREARAQKKDLAAIQKAGLPDWQHYSWEFIDTSRWLEIVYDSLERKK